MIFLIWLGFCFVAGLIQAFFQACGISLGGLPTIALYSILLIPADRLSKAWYIKKYKEKFPVYILNEISRAITLYKNDFLTKKNFNVEDEGVDFFDMIKSKVSKKSAKEIDELMIQIVKTDSSPTAYILDLLDSESIKMVEKGNIVEIIKQTGRTYTISKIYEYVNDIQFEKGMLTPVQYTNKLAYIEYICKQNSN